MIFTTINKSAADAALTAIVGPQWKGIIEKLYELLDTAERQGYSDGYIEGRVDAGEDNHSEGYESGFKDAAEMTAGASQERFLEGWESGYNTGIAVATSTEQPELPEGFIGTDYAVEYPEGYIEGTGYYEGDSGDETTYDPEEERPVDNTGDYLPPMQEQNRRPTNPFAWS